MMSFLFTDQSGQVFGVAPEDLLLTASPHPYNSVDGASSSKPMGDDRQAASAMNPSPLIAVSSFCNTPAVSVAALPIKKSSSRRKHSVSDQSGNGSGFQLPKVLLAYNDYGELVDVEKLKCPVNSSDLSVTETLRLILRAYRQ